MTEQNSPVVTDSEPAGRTKVLIAASHLLKSVGPTGGSYDGAHTMP